MHRGQHVQVPTARGGRDPFITSGDIQEPYESQTQYTGLARVSSILLLGMLPGEVPSPEKWSACGEAGDLLA